MKRTHRALATAAAITAGAAIMAGPALAVKSITFTLGDQSTPVSSYSWGATNSGSAQSGGGAGAGKVAVQDFHMVKESDAMSVSLAQKVFTGQHTPTAALTFSDGIFTSAYCFEDVLVSSFQTGASAKQDRPVDQFSLTFAQIGFKVGTATFNWNIATNEGGNPC